MTFHSHLIAVETRQPAGSPRCWAVKRQLETTVSKLPEGVPARTVVGLQFYQPLPGRGGR